MRKEKKAKTFEENMEEKNVLLLFNKTSNLRAENSTSFLIVAATKSMVSTKFQAPEKKCKHPS